MVMVRKLMTGKNFKPASLKQRISFLAKQIKTKKTLIQKLIDQKHELRQSYIVSMEKMRQNIVQKHLGNHSIQDDYNFEIVRLDKEEQVLTLEIDELLNQRDRLNKSLLDQDTGLFISKKFILAFLTFSFFVVCLGLLVTQKHILFSMFHNSKEFRINNPLISMDQFVRQISHLPLR